MADIAEVAAVGDALARVFGGGLTVESVEPIPPWAVARVRLASSDATVPASVVVKWLRQNAAGFRTDPAQLDDERLALEFLAQIDLDLAPHLHGYDSELGVLVMQDLAPAVALWDLLGTDDVRGRRGLVSFARSMGQLHASTAGRADEFYEGHAPGAPMRDRTRVAGSHWDLHLPNLAAVGIGAHDGTRADMATVRRILVEPGPFLAMTNGDSGANNFLVDAGRGWITDWELAGFRHALVDAAALWVPGAMWMTVQKPDAQVEDAYRAALAVGVAAAADDAVFGLHLTAACLAVALDRAQRVPQLDQREPGHHSRIQMISTLDAAARVARRHEALPELAHWVQGVAEALRRRWPDADVELPDAYTRRE